MDNSNRFTHITVWIIGTRNNNCKVGWLCGIKKLPKFLLKFYEKKPKLYQSHDFLMTNFSFPPYFTEHNSLTKPISNLFSMICALLTVR